MTEIDLEKELKERGFEKLEKEVLVANRYAFFYDTPSDNYNKLYAIDLSKVHIDKKKLSSKTKEDLKELSFDSLDIFKPPLTVYHHCAIKDSSTPNRLFRVRYTYHTLLSEIDKQQSNPGHGRFYGNIIAVQDGFNIYVKTQQ